MRFAPWRALSLICALGLLTACASEAPPPIPAVPAPAPPRALPPALPPIAAAPHESLFAALPGWNLEDHAAALAAFRDGCAHVKVPPMAAVCARALALGPLDEARSRAFLERSFRPEPVATQGLLTGYFSPAYEARSIPGGEFTAPVRPHPMDLRRDGSVQYADRREIEDRPSPDAQAWMRPEDLFFLQVQGSGTLTFENGQRKTAVSDGSNGATFVALSTIMRQSGLLADNDTSAESIRAWLAAHRGDQAKSLMDLNPRYVFFRLRPDEGREPMGSAGVPLVPGRSVAVDPTWHPFGELIWLDADAPRLLGAFPSYRRLVVALDTGGAIKGEARADLYLGRGPLAGLEAGRVRHQLRLYRLTPIEQ